MAEQITHHGEKYLRLHLPGHDKPLYGTHIRGTCCLHLPQKKPVKYRKTVFHIRKESWDRSQKMWPCQVVKLHNYERTVTQREEETEI
jgi:hypothetical protein